MNHCIDCRFCASTGLLDPCCMHPKHTNDKVDLVNGVIQHDFRPCFWIRDQQVNQDELMDCPLYDDRRKSRYYEESVERLRPTTQQQRKTVLSEETKDELKKALAEWMEKSIHKAFTEFSRAFSRAMAEPMPDEITTDDKGFVTAPKP